MFIGLQNSIEFRLPHYEIPQLSSHYCALLSLPTVFEGSEACMPKRQTMKMTLPIHGNFM